MRKRSLCDTRSNTVRRIAVATASALALGAVLGACGSANASSGRPAPATQAADIGASPTPTAVRQNALRSSPSFSMSLTVTNNSSYTLQYLRDDSAYKHYGNITSGPSATIAPYGGKDTISYESNNVGGGQIDLVYKPIADNAAEYHGYFYIPTVAVNTCIAGLVGGSPDVLNFKCTMPHGYTGVAPTLTITDKTVLPVYAFQKTDAPHTQLMEVKGFDPGDDTPIDTWQRTISGSKIQGNQQWTFRPDGSAGFGQLISVGTRKCIEVDDATGDIMQRPCSTTGIANQLWKLVPNGDGSDSLQLKLGSGDHWVPGAYYLATTKDAADVENATPLTLATTTSDRTSWDPQRQN